MASLPLLVLLVLTPAQIYAGNQPYFDHRYDVILDLSLVQAIILFFLYLLFRAIPRLRKPVAYPLAVTGALLCAVSVFAPSPVPELLRGRIGNVEISPAWAMFDVVVLLLLWVTVRYAPEQTLVRISGLFCGLLFVAVPSGVAFEALTSGSTVTAWARDGLAGPARVRDAPNVYHFVFDGFDGTLFRRVVSELGLASSFDGFVWYSNAYSNYTSTRLSLPSFMTGKLFDEETIDDATAVKMAQTGGLVKILASSGYSVTQYNAYFINNHRLANERNSTATIEEETYGGLRYLVQLLDLSLLLTVPQVFKDQVVADGRGLIGNAVLRNERSIADWSRNPPLLSLMLFARLIDDEPRRPARGQYVNGHFLIPHAPMVMTADCGYKPGQPRTQRALIEQTMCTVIRLAAFLNLLRDLARFQDAMIVLQSDHGIIRRDRPLLLLKYPGAKAEPLAIADYPVQLVDVAPTILEALEITYSGIDGVSLQNDDPNARPEIKVWVAKPSLL